MLSIDEFRFNKIVQSYSSQLFSSVVYITRNRQTAEDIVQETFLRLWENRVDITPDNIGGWLHKVASNMSYRYLKRESCKTKIYSFLRAGKPQFCTEVEEYLVQKENRIIFNEIYARLPEKQQVVYQLSRRYGLSRYEIADQLNISPHTVKNHLAKAIQFLKDHIVSCCLLLIFFVFNNIFFNRSSTKNDSRYLNKENNTNKINNIINKYQDISSAPLEELK